MCQELGAGLVSASLIALGLLSGLSLPRQRRRLPFGYSCREDATRELAGVVGVMALFSLSSLSRIENSSMTSRLWTMV